MCWWIVEELEPACRWWSQDADVVLEPALSWEDEVDGAEVLLETVVETVVGACIPSGSLSMSMISIPMEGEASDRVRAALGCGTKSSAVLADGLRSRPSSEPTCGSGRTRVRPLTIGSCSNLLEPPAPCRSPSVLVRSYGMWVVVLLVMSVDSVGVITMLRTLMIVLGRTSLSA